jgi:adenylosuccinate lyase
MGTRKRISNKVNVEKTVEIAKKLSDRKRFVYNKAINNKMQETGLSYKEAKKLVTKFSKTRNTKESKHSKFKKPVLSQQDRFDKIASEIAKEFKKLEE